MTALVRYHAALLLRSQRWLPPALLYAVVTGIGVRAGEPVLGSLGYAAAGLLPVTAWLVRVCLNQEPPAARHVTAAAAGRERVHLAALLAATACAGLLGAAGTLVVTAISAPVDAGREVAVDRLPAALAGLLTAAVCVLLGAAVGALTTRPLIPARAWSIAAASLTALLALVAAGSPARYAVTGLVTGSLSGTVTYPWLPLAGAAALAAAAAALACRLTAWRE
ncbi:ABC transporter [Streptomyces sp. NPDC093546]|uniref:ABC transporter n=1 Tax=Streptomyces sp. NPDC093546 TaxID=3366040 RepID=UPI00382CBB49